MSKERKEFESWLKKLLKKYIPALKLERYRIDLEYKDSLGNSIMECTSRYPYLDPTIRYCDTAIKEWKNDKDYTEQVFLHELCHILTDAFYNKSVKRFCTQDEIEDERENITDTLTNILYTCLNKK